jgi:chorismate lyase
MGIKALTKWNPEVSHFDGFLAPQNTVSWLLEIGSITARLRMDWPDVCVDVLMEGLDAPQPDEQLRLSLADAQVCWVREVQLQADGTPLLHARTVVPTWDHNNPWRTVSTLGQRPLGELLFALPHLQRSPLEFALTEPASRSGHGPLRAIPARRRVFEREGAHLLLTEAFDFLAMPFLPEQASAQPKAQTPPCKGW